MRPTIEDLARAAGVSRATVNRVIGQPAKVRPATRALVAEAAAEIGFHGLPVLAGNVRAARKPFRLTVLSQQPNRWFSEQMAKALRAVRDDIAHRRQIHLKVDRLSDFSPEALAERMLAQARRSDALAVIGAEHQIVTRAIARITEAGTPVYALVTPLSAPSLAGYAGIDARQAGRTAAWAFDRLLGGGGGQIGILLGSPRYRVHELAESGFRSYFREVDREVRLLDPLVTYESDGICREMTERLLAEHPDLRALYLCGGGTLGMLSALRDSGRAREIATIAYDLNEDTRLALLDQTLDLLIAQPFGEIARRGVEMILADEDKATDRARSMTYVDFALITPENLGNHGTERVG